MCLNESFTKEKWAELVTVCDYLKRTHRSRTTRNNIDVSELKPVFIQSHTHQHIYTNVSTCEFCDLVKNI